MMKILRKMLYTFGLFVSGVAQPSTVLILYYVCKTKRVFCLRPEQRVEVAEGNEDKGLYRFVLITNEMNVWAEYSVCL